MAEDLDRHIPTTRNERVAKLKIKTERILLTTQSFTITKIIDINHFSTSQKLFQTTAYIYPQLCEVTEEVISAKLHIGGREALDH